MIFRFIESKPDASAPMSSCPRWASVGRMWGLELSVDGTGHCLTLVRNDDFCVDPLWGDERCEYLFRTSDPVVTYCLGTSWLAVILFPRLLINTLRGVDEQATTRHVRSMLPEQRYFPIHADAGCWRRLCVYAGATDLAETCLWVGGHADLAGDDAVRLPSIYAAGREVA